ncbi:hypothetical protein CCP3SC1AL1_770015 [Gammaproteobacteria bacterium]
MRVCMERVAADGEDGGAEPTAGVYTGKGAICI